jgi:hypothetical protein
MRTTRRRDSLIWLGALPSGPTAVLLTPRQGLSIELLKDSPMPSCEPMAGLRPKKPNTDTLLELHWRLDQHRRRAQRRGHKDLAADLCMACRFLRDLNGMIEKSRREGGR